MPLIKELKELWQGYHFDPPQQVLQDPLSVLPFSRPLRMSQIEEIGPQFYYMCPYQNHKSTIVTWLRTSPQQRQAIFSEYEVRYSILEDLTYLDATRMVNLDIIHNLILGILKDHANFKLCIPECKSKIYFRSRKKSNGTNTSDSNSMTSNSSLDKITLREARSLRRDTAKIINESLPTTSSQCPPLTRNIHLVVLR
ncbi:hypothetical protein O181_011731 [Austropuccinia psidii MF-1]|uniref:Uncharacterized protein n=1 Tax=Austropuccinia psidii MF-1 TaxID=1389203 RepID=A0A9Q3GLL5_9BASI|nr:hypothetical protein [Austropuccinia psidii MF-1]